MKIKSLKNQKGIEFDGLFLITPNKFKDERGYFYESWNKKTFDREINNQVNFVQDNHSSSIQGVLRGLHYQTNPNSQGKLIRCPYGEIYDVAVDLRISSKSFGMWTGVYLNSENMNQLWIPEGFAHGFLTISKVAEVFYKTTDYWNKESEQSIKWNDEKLSIDWPLEKIKKSFPLLSNKDSNSLAFEESFKYFY